MAFGLRSWDASGRVLFDSEKYKLFHYTTELAAPNTAPVYSYPDLDEEILVIAEPTSNTFYGTAGRALEYTISYASGYPVVTTYPVVTDPSLPSVETFFHVFRTGKVLP